MGLHHQREVQVRSVVMRLQLEDIKNLINSTGIVSTSNQHNSAQQLRQMISDNLMVRSESRNGLVSCRPRMLNVMNVSKPGSACHWAHASSITLPLTDHICCAGGDPHSQATDCKGGLDGGLCIALIACCKGPMHAWICKFPNACMRVIYRPPDWSNA